MKPLELGPNQIRRFYRGGRRISEFRRLPSSGDDAPEDWVASSTSVFGDGGIGPTRLEDGVLLGDVLAGEREAFFEPAHLARFGSEPGILIKLLDAGERLPLHFHPDGDFASAHLRQAYGKTEAWIILDAEADAHVHVGFSRDVAEDELAKLAADQDVEAMLDAMHPLPVRAGDSIFVPAGLPHAIGEGILLLELQEPSDLSLLLEWEGVMPEDRALLGLPRTLALSAVTRSAVDLRRLTATRRATLFPEEADAFFRADVVGGGAVLEPSFSVLIGYTGEGAVLTDSDTLAVRRGSTVLVPFAAGPVELTGSFRAIRCRAPLF